MADQKKYIETSNASPTIIQGFLDDTSVSGAAIYANLGYTVITVDGTPQLVGQTNGVDNLDAQRTDKFDTTKTKYNATGFYCLNARYKYADTECVDDLPDFNDYVGLNSVDSVSEWIEPSDE